MDLRRYLFEHNIKQKDFARKIGYSRNYVSMICNGRVKPYKRVAKMIKIETNGLVDYLPEENKE